MRTLLEAIPNAGYTTDPQGRILFYNAEAAQLWGREPDPDVRQWCGSWRLFWPDGNAMPHDQSPMAIALRERRAIRGAEMIVERPDGVRHHLLSYPTPLFDPSNTLIGAVNVLVDVSDRSSNTYFERRLASIVESSHDAIISKDLNGVITTWNESAEHLFGYSASEVVGRLITILIPPNRLDEEPAILDRIRRGERVTPYQTVRQRKDGTLIDISLTVSPVRNDEGLIVGASKIARDITELKRSQEQQTLLLAEISHRVKNALAVAGGLVALSARAAHIPKDVVRAIQERLNAYSRAYELTRPGIAAGQFRAGQQTTLHTLIRTVVAPFLDAREDGGEPNVRLNGTDLLIDAAANTSLALVLHELATNAAKHGALSISGGQVQIHSRLDAEVLEIQWRENGGPSVSPPKQEGFGTLLTGRTVEGQLGGQIDRDWREGGVLVTLRLPVDRLGSG